MGIFTHYIAYRDRGCTMFPCCLCNNSATTSPTTRLSFYGLVNAQPNLSVIPSIKTADHDDSKVTLICGGVSRPALGRGGHNPRYDILATALRRSDRFWLFFSSFQNYRRCPQTWRSRRGAIPSIACTLTFQDAPNTPLSPPRQCKSA
jgi:hypothetical protein